MKVTNFVEKNTWIQEYRAWLMLYKLNFLLYNYTLTLILLWSASLADQSGIIFSLWDYFWCIIAGKEDWYLKNHHTGLTSQTLKSLGKINLSTAVSPPQGKFGNNEQTFSRQCWPEPGMCFTFIVQYTSRQNQIPVTLFTKSVICISRCTCQK